MKKRGFTRSKGRRHSRAWVGVEVGDSPAEDGKDLIVDTM